MNMQNGMRASWEVMSKVRNHKKDKAYRHVSKTKEMKLGAEDKQELGMKRKSSCQNLETSSLTQSFKQKRR